MKTVHKKRLLKLAAFLRELPRKKFDIAAWSNECGTVCCAGGWACTIPSLKRAGLRLVKDKWDDLVPVFGKRQRIQALEGFFGIDQAAAYQFFMPSTYGDAPTPFRPTPKTVAKRIEEHVKIATSPAAKVYQELHGRGVAA